MQVEKINKNALELCKILQQNGYQSYIVGGCIRDILMNLNPKDWDIATNATPDIVQNLFPVTYPTGLQHGTVMVSLNNELFDVTTFRTDGQYFDARRPSSVNFVSTIEEDLSRRDLTINAIAYDPVNDKLVDPYQGIKDIKNKIIKCVGNPKDRFSEDALRILRVARFAARFNYHVELETQKAIQETNHQLKLISKERICGELEKLLMSPTPSTGLNLLLDTNCLEYISLLIAKDSLIGFGQLDHLPKDIDFETRLFALYSVVEPDLQRDLGRLRLSNKSIDRVLFLQKMNKNYHGFVSVLGGQSYKKIYPKFIAFIKNDTPDTFEHSLKQFCQYRKFLQDEENYEHICNSLFVWARKDLQLNGNDLLSLGFNPGIKIKNCLDEAYDLILKNPEMNIHSKLMDFAIQFLEKENSL